MHEMSHWLEGNDPIISNRLREHLRKRISGETVYDIRSQQEVIFPDKFISSYMGKIYPKVKGNIPWSTFLNDIKTHNILADSFGATELLSVGIEWFYTDPGRFASYDPETFDLIFGLIKMGDK